MASAPRVEPSREARALDLPATPPAELYRCPVRRRYLWQLLRYRRPNRRWRRRLHAGAAGMRASAHALAELLRVAQEQCSFYPRAFAEAGVDWRDLRRRSELAGFPALSRGALQERYLELFSRRVGKSDIEEGWLGTTSGSTGEPVRFFMDGESIHFFTAFIRFLWEWHRLGPLPTVGSTGIVLLCTLPRSAIYQTRLPLFRGTLFRKLHLEEPAALETLQRLSPAVVTGDPDSLGRLAEALESRALRLRPRLVLSSAFTLGERLAGRLRAATGAAVIDYYSLAETGPIAWRCPADWQRLHVLEGAVEPEEDRGELLVTNLRNCLFPLVRYRTGDLASVEETGSPCACGFRGRSLTRFEGRLAARFLDAAGRRVDPSQLQPLISKLAVRQFQLEQAAAGEVRLRYFGPEELEEGSTRALEQALERLLSGRVALRRERAPAPLFAPGEKPIVYRTCVG